MGARMAGNYRHFQQPLFVFTLDGLPGESPACRVWSGWRFIHSWVESHRCLLIRTNLTTLTVRRLRGWPAVTPRTAADLHGLCVSYQCVGAMGLPRDIIEEIVQHHREDLGTLLACSLTCRALFSAVRRLIHERVRFWLWRSYPPRTLMDRITVKVLPGRRPRDWPKVYLRYLSMAEEHGLLGHARDVCIDIGQSFVPEALEALLPHFRSFTQVHTQ